MSRLRAAGAVRAAATSALAACLLALAGCGAAGAGHGSPEGAVRGFVDGIRSGDVNASCGFVQPSEQDSCKTSLSSLKSLGKVEIKDFDVISTDTHGDTADVKVKGQSCASFATAGFSFNTCSAVAGAGGPRPASDTVQCVRIGGQWYVNLGIGGGVTSPGPGSSSSGGSSSSPESGSSSSQSESASGSASSS